MKKSLKVQYIKAIFLLFFSLMSISASFSQEDEALPQENFPPEEDVLFQEEPSPKKDVLPQQEPSSEEVSSHKYATQPYGFYLGAKFIVNQIDYEAKSLPFVVCATAGFEYEFRVKFFALQPSFDLSFMHYLWTGSMACHAEPENRTAFTVAFNAEFPLMLSFDIKQCTISFGPSIAFLARGSLLDLGIKANEGIDDGGITAKDEVAAINAYHWQSGRFFYPAIRFKTEYTLENGWKAGVMLNTYLPISNIWSEKIAETASGKVPFMHDGIFTLAIVIHPGKKL